MTPERLADLALSAAFPPGLPMPSGSTEHIRRVMYQAVREALDAAATACYADAYPGHVSEYMRGWGAGKRASIAAIRVVRDELAP